MTAQRGTVQAKLDLLELARRLGNISQACRMMGHSRDSFYRFRTLDDKGGEEALKGASRRKPLLKNRVAPRIEQRVVELAAEEPSWGQARVARELHKEGLRMSPAGVRRHNLENCKKRWKALDAKQDGTDPAPTSTSLRRGRSSERTEGRSRSKRLDPIRLKPRSTGPARSEASGSFTSKHRSGLNCQVESFSLLG